MCNLLCIVAWYSSLVPFSVFAAKFPSSAPIDNSLLLLEDKWTMPSNFSLILFEHWKQLWNLRKSEVWALGSISKRKDQAKRLCFKVIDGYRNIKKLEQHVLHEFNWVQVSKINCIWGFMIVHQKKDMWTHTQIGDNERWPFHHVNLIMQNRMWLSWMSVFKKACLVGYLVE